MNWAGAVFGVSAAIALLGALGAVGFRSIFHNILSFALAMLGVAGFFVVVPEATNRLAHAVGVGRGADLLTYLVELALFFIIIHYYTLFVDLDARVTALVREIALLRAEIEARGKGGE